MFFYLIKRIFYTIPSLIIIATIVFFMIHLIPGDPALTMLGVNATDEDIKALREELRLDEPIGKQYFQFIMNIARGNFGKSIYYEEDTLSLIAERLPNTLELTFTALIIATLIAIPLGIISAICRYSLFDYLATIFALTGTSTPVFWLGIMLTYFFSLKLGWFPLSGRGGPIWTAKGIIHIILPATSLGLIMMASTMRLMRSSLLEVLRQDYIRTARAKGLSERVVIWKHALKNSISPVITNIGLQMGVLLGGAFLTETLFAWPGIGRLAVQAIRLRDFPIIQAVTLIITVLFVSINIIVDFIYRLIDPKIKYK